MFCVAEDEYASITTSTVPEIIIVDQNCNCSDNTSFSTSLENFDAFDGLDTSFKSYMSYEAITNETSDQWQLQQDAYNDYLGIFRMYEGYYMVAIGTGYGLSVGDTFIAILSSGVEVYCIVGDIKQDVHTDSTNSYTSTGYTNDAGELMVNVLEFIVADTDATMQLTGSVSHLHRLEGDVISIVAES